MKKVLKNQILTSFMNNPNKFTYIYLLKYSTIYKKKLNKAIIHNWPACHYTTYFLINQSIFSSLLYFPQIHFSFFLLVSSPQIRFSINDWEYCHNDRISAICSLLIYLALNEIRIKNHFLWIWIIILFFDI